jgi:hypothetical protein
MFDRHTNMFRGQFAGSSGSSHDIARLPFLRAPATCDGTSAPAAAASFDTSIGLRLSCGADGSHPIRSARTLKSISEPS